MRKIPFCRDRTHVPTCQKVTWLPLRYRGDRLGLATTYITGYIRMHDVGPPPRPLLVTEEDTPPTSPASYRVPPRARHLLKASVRSGPQEGCVPKRGSYHSTTATSVRGSHGQATRRAPPEAADGRNTSRGGRSRQGTPGVELDGLSQGRLPRVRSHRRLYGGQPAHIRS